MWQEQNNSITKEFEFEDFKSALRFVVQIGEVAEKLNHHPGVELSWGKVKITLSTHDAGKVTAKDYKIAEHIDDLYRSEN